MDRIPREPIALKSKSLIPSLPCDAATDHLSPFVVLRGFLFFCCFRQAKVAKPAKLTALADIASIGWSWQYSSACGDKPAIVRPQGLRENLLARLTRHEILKEDRFMMLVDETRHFFANNRSEILRGLSAAGVVAVLVAGYYYYSAQQEEQSKEELARALATYHATVGETESSGSAGPVFFETPARKYEQALSELQEIVFRHSSRAAGKIATYYSGLCLHQLDKSPEAVSLLEPLSQEQSDFGALALAALGRIYEDTADLAKATEAYQQLVERNALTTPGETLAMKVALLYEQQNQQEQAAKMYEKVINDFPTSPASTEAEQRLRKIVP